MGLFHTDFRPPFIKRKGSSDDIVDETKRWALDRRKVIARLVVFAQNGQLEPHRSEIVRILEDEVPQWGEVLSRRYSERFTQSLRNEITEIYYSLADALLALRDGKFSYAERLLLNAHRYTEGAQSGISVQVTALERGSAMQNPAAQSSLAKDARSRVRPPKPLSKFAYSSAA